MTVTGQMHSMAIVIFLRLIVSVDSVLRCAQNVKPKDSSYYFVAPCTQSKMKMIASNYLNDLKTCQQFARWKMGFALNFVERDLLHKKVSNYSGATCLVYDCPEFDVLTSLETNTVFDYYSSYARPMPKSNVSCIPKVGIFQLHRERKNFTDASIICEDEGGYLADITSELYTVQLSSLVASLKIKQVYVGLDELQYSGEFLTSKGVPLNCLKYRAWAPGEPKPLRGEKCAVLTAQEQWKVTLCKKRLPFLCELKPRGPFRPCSRFRHPRRRRNCIKKFRRTFPNENRYPKCGAPIKNVDQQRNNLNQEGN